MMSFKEWLNDTEQGTKPWKAGKPYILQHWKSLAPGLAFTGLKAVPLHHKGKTLNFDGLRITGSSNFINSILSRLKDITNFENENTRLELIYKQQVNSQTMQPIPDSYVFYLQAKERNVKNKGPKLTF